jgi:hypothetical protein
MHFSELRHDLWKEKHQKWEYAWDHYTGKYGDLERIGGRITNYLHQKYQRENNKAFEERKEVSDIILDFATVVDSINGVLASKEDETHREWGALGDPEDPDSTAYALSQNADVKGTNWVPLMKQAGIKLTVMHNVWGLVEGVTDTDEAHVKVVNPNHIVNWYPSHGELTEVLVKEQRDTRSSMYDTGSREDDVYTLFTLDGWKRFKYEDGVEVPLGDGEYAFYKTARRRKRILPIFRTEIPMPRDIGYLLAKKENYIYNAKSVRDFAIRNLSFSILKLAVTDEAEYTAILQGLEKGANVIAQYAESKDHEFISPDSSFLAEADKTLKQDKDDFYKNAFQRYGEAARQVTATQARLESQTGIEAFLSLLVTSIDEFENDCFKRLEQVYFPDNPSVWGDAKVERSQEFQPDDVNETFATMSRAILDADRSGSISIREKVKRLNPGWTDEEIDEEVERISQQQGALPTDMIGA